VCELLGMSANVPTDICFSFAGLIERGGKTGPHRDGWGISFYEGKGTREFKDPCSSCDSKIAELLKYFPIKSCIVISHIRKANRGRICLENTHPFTRELWGCNWTYAHNGQLKGIKKWDTPHFKPIGTTDSEHAFCWILSQIKERFPKPPKSEKTLWRFVNKLASQVSELGVFNMMLSDSKVFYTHCSTKLVWISRRAPFGKARLVDNDMTIDFSQHTTENDIVTVFATAPLTSDETWQKMEKGDFLVFKLGEQVYSS